LLCDSPILKLKEIAMTTVTVREIAIQQPTSIRVFEKFGIDYCCGGRKPLAETCEAGNLPIENVLAELEAAATTSAPETVDWSKASLADLSKHVVSLHHEYVKKELPRLALLAQKVVARHGDTKAELPAIQKTLEQLSDELLQHLAKEEAVLFPYIVRLEIAVADGSSKPKSCFGTVSNPIAMMTQEHDAAGALMAGIRSLSHDFLLPEEACPTFHAFYDGLKEFEQDLHQHIHLENNILFPRAIDMEASAT
jgi:regulator of cell morphogenesis and NO signaling